MKAHGSTVVECTTLRIITIVGSSPSVPDGSDARLGCVLCSSPLVCCLDRVLRAAGSSSASWACSSSRAPREARASTTTRASPLAFPPAPLRPAWPPARRGRRIPSRTSPSARTTRWRAIDSYESSVPTHCVSLSRLPRKQGRARVCHAHCAPCSLKPCLNDN
jgi:hypothetical protein